MNITLLCNAGLAFECKGQVLLVDLPNEASKPFVALSELHWKMVCQHSEKICGFFFTHNHPDHMDKERLDAYLNHAPRTPVFFPDRDIRDGTKMMGPFSISYYAIEHAPIPMAPPHVAAIIEADGCTVYVSADAKLDCAQHRKILGKRKVDAAFWNSMYLSYAETRALMVSVSARNYIYHMPLKSDGDGMWRKVEKNFERYAGELQNVTVLDTYPTKIYV